MNNINMSIVIILLKDITTKCKGEYARGQSQFLVEFTIHSSHKLLFNGQERFKSSDIISYIWYNGQYIVQINKFLLNQIMK